MSLTRKQWKTKAQYALRGNYMIAVLGMMATVGVNLLGSVFSDYLFPGGTILSTVLAECFLFILSLIISIFSAGYSFMLMNLTRGQEAGLGDLLYFFRNQPDRVIVAGFFLSLLQLAASAPGIIYSYTSSMGSTLDEQLAWMTNYLILILVASVLQLLLTMPFTLAYYLLADDAEMGGMEALKLSARMMKGHYGQFLLLQISFLPMILLSAFLLYLPLLWVIPYMEVANVEFYRDLNGEFSYTEES